METGEKMGSGMHRVESELESRVTRVWWWLRLRMKKTESEMDGA